MMMRRRYTKTAQVALAALAFATCVEMSNAADGDSENRRAGNDSVWNNAATSTDGFCRSVQEGAGELCAIGYEVFRRELTKIARIRIDVRNDVHTNDQGSHNEYLVWHDCGGADFRILAREPQQQPQIERWSELTADGSSDLHRALRDFGSWACSLQT